MHTDESKPWITMLKLFEAGSIKDLENFINSLSSRDVLYAFSHLSILEQEKLLAALAPKDAADLIEELPDTQALELIERMDPSRAASIVDELPSTEQADILGEMEWDDAEAILVQMDPQEAAEARKLVKYPEDVAGGLMATEYLAYLEELRVLDVIEDLKRNSKKYADYNVQYIYIVNKSQKLVGILRIRDLLLSATDRVLQSFMIKDPISTLESTGLEDLADLFHHYNYFGIPVVDCDKRLVGVVRRSAVREVLTERADADHMKSQGIISGDELRSMSLFSRSKGRLSWLSLNVILNIMAASIIAMYQDT
ncbi:MAG: CBS domain-containing protein, partial [Bdellovibrionota bacterium]